MYIETFENMTFAFSGWEDFKKRAHGLLVQQNAGSVRSILQGLNERLKNQTGYTAIGYIILILDKLEDVPKRRNQSNQDANDLRNAVKIIRQVINKTKKVSLSILTVCLQRMYILGDKTLYQAKLIADEMLFDCQVVYEKAMCDGVINTKKVEIQLLLPIFVVYP